MPPSEYITASCGDLTSATTFSTVSISHPLQQTPPSSTLPLDDANHERTAPTAEAAPFEPLTRALSSSSSPSSVLISMFGDDPQESNNNRTDALGRHLVRLVRPAEARGVAAGTASEAAWTRDTRRPCNNNDDSNNSLNNNHSSMVSNNHMNFNNLTSNNNNTNDINSSSVVAGVANCGGGVVGGRNGNGFVVAADGGGETDTLDMFSEPTSLVNELDQILDDTRSDGTITPHAEDSAQGFADDDYQDQMELCLPNDPARSHHSRQASQHPLQQCQQQQQQQPQSRQPQQQQPQQTQQLQREQKQPQPNQQHSSHQYHQQQQQQSLQLNHQQLGEDRQCDEASGNGDERMAADDAATSVFVTGRPTFQLNINVGSLGLPDVVSGTAADANDVSATDGQPGNPLHLSNDVLMKFQRIASSDAS